MTVRSDHPRIWLTPTRLTNLKAKLATSARWNQVKTICDTYSGATWDVGIMNYALAYQMTGNTVYADKAITLMTQSVSAGLSAITGDVGYQVRNCLPAAAIVYDWCYDHLTTIQRSQLQAAMEQWADWVWPETNPGRAGNWGVADPGNNYYHSFMFTWMVGLALSGDSAKASGYIAAAEQRFQQAVIPYLNTLAAGGYMAEGTNYGTSSAHFISWYLDAHFTATGEDLFTANGLTWPKDNVVCSLYLTVPTLDRRYPGGDQPRDSGAGLSDQDRGVILANLAHVDLTTAGHMKWWLDNINPPVDLLRNDQWEEFLWYRDEVTAVPYNDQPTQYLSPGAGVVTSRSNWSTAATQTVMACAPVVQSHQELAAGMYTVFGQGEWVVGLARLKSNSGLLGDTINNNMPVFSGRGQYSTPSDLARYAPNVAKLSPFLAKTTLTSGYNYFVADCAAGYNYFIWPSAVIPFAYYQRHLIHIVPNIVLVLDWYQPAQNNFDKRFPLNLIAEPTITDQTFSMSVRNAALFGKIIGSSQVQLQKVPFGEDPTLPPTSWRVDAVVPSGSINAEYLLTALEVAPSSQSKPIVLNNMSASLVAGSIVVQLSGQVVTIDPTNKQVSIASSGLVAPPSGAVIIPSGGVASLQQQYAALLVIAAGLSGTVNSLTNTVTSLMSTNQSLQASNATLNATVATLTAQVASLNTQVMGLQADKATLQTQNSSLSGIISSIKSILGV